MPCDEIIKTRIIPMRLSRIFFQGRRGGGVKARQPENSLDNVVVFLFVFISPQLILQFTEGIEWF